MSIENLLSDPESDMEEETWRKRHSFSARDATPEKGDHGGDVPTAGHCSLGLGMHTPPWVRKNVGILTPTLSRVAGQAVRKQSLPPPLTPLESGGRCPEEQAEQDPQPAVPAGCVWTRNEQDAKWG